MPYSPVLIGHICAGSLGLLSVTAAKSFRKGFALPCPARSSLLVLNYRPLG